MRLLLAVSRDWLTTVTPDSFADSGDFSGDTREPETMPADPTPAEARAALAELRPEWTWRPWTAEDVPAVYVLFRAIEAVDRPVERQSETELREFLETTRVTPELDSLVGIDASGLVRAVALNYDAKPSTELTDTWLFGGVHPEDRGQGVGRRLLGWQIARMRQKYAQIVAGAEDVSAVGPLRLRVYAGEHASTQQRLVERLGFTLQRYICEMDLVLTDEHRAPLPPPDGIRFEPLSDEWQEPTRLVRNEAFADHWGASQVDPDRWAEVWASTDLRRSWCFVAVDPYAIEPGDARRGCVGFVLSAAYSQDWEAQGYTSGYIDELGVCESHRGLGIGSALIARSLRAMAEAGLDRGGIGVDTANGSGAMNLYESLGFVTTARTFAFARG